MVEQNSSTNHSATVPSQRISPLFQLILIAISIPIIGFGLYKGISKTEFNDPAPNLITITPQHVEEFGLYSNSIKVGLLINQFQTFDIIKNDFIFNGILWFQLNPGVISLDTLSQFSFERGKILDISEPDVRLIDDRLVVRYNIRVQCNSALTYTNFPLDNHRIFITLTHKFVSPSEILFTASERNFIVNTQVDGWNLINRQAMAGFEKAEIDEYDKRLTVNYPRVIFELDYASSGLATLFTIFLPLLLLFFVASFSLSLAPKEGLMFAIGSIIALFAYRIVIGMISPYTRYFKLSDSIFFVFVVAIFALIFFQILDTSFTRLTKRHKQIILLIIYALVVGIILYLLWN